MTGLVKGFIFNSADNKLVPNIKVRYILRYYFYFCGLFCFIFECNLSICIIFWKITVVWTFFIHKYYLSVNLCIII